MDKLQNILFKLKDLGCCGIKISFEDEGALLNEIITIRYLTSKLNINLSVKIGGCEAKRDIVDCIDICSDSIVAPMIESSFALNKFLGSLKQYDYCGEKGINIETINAYNNINDLEKDFDKIDFITFGRVDFVGSLGKDRSYVNNDEILEIVIDIFKRIKEKSQIKCYLGGSTTMESTDFIKTLINLNLLDKFETRYIIFNVKDINFNNFDELLYHANVFEVEWMKYISSKYSLSANKDIQRIKMAEERINKNN